MTFELPPLPYAYDALEPYIDARTMETHHTKHHAAYIAKLNEAADFCDIDLGKELENVLRDISVLPESLRQTVRNNGGGHLNHSLFWQIMCPGGTPLEGQLSEDIIRVFGSFASFQSEFTRAAAGRFGSGWAWLCVESSGKPAVISTPNQDSPLMLGSIPVLGLDVWEHAYYLKYQNRRAEYISAWWNVVDWRRVASLYTAALEAVRHVQAK